jgi:UDP-glucose 4-epimerase
MNALITGGAGFIGSHLARRLAVQGHDVRILDNLHRVSPEHAEALRQEGLQLIEGDIRDTEAVSGACGNVDIVYHLAAQSNVMGAVSDVQYSASTNVMGTVNVLASARKAGVRRVVFTSSREAYGEARYLPVNEQHPMKPKNTYGASKVAGEAYCRAFASEEMQVTILRLANVYGPGDRDRVIPLFIEAAVAGQPLVVFGGRQILDFVWIDTVINALIAAAGKDLTEPVNIATGVGTSIVDLARHIVQHVGMGSAIDMQPARAIEVTTFTADTTQMRAQLGIEPDAEPLAHVATLIDIARATQHGVGEHARS